VRASEVHELLEQLNKHTPTFQGLNVPENAIVLPNETYSGPNVEMEGRFIRFYIIVSFLYYQILVVHSALILFQIWGRGKFLKIFHFSSPKIKIFLDKFIFLQKIKKFQI
jgi:hypothetical protein